MAMMLLKVNEIKEEETKRKEEEKQKKEEEGIQRTNIRIAIMQ